MASALETQLKNLAEKEDALLEQVRHLTEQPDQHSNIRMGIERDYLTIWESYSELAATSADIEALKRAIFIQWYGQAEPPVLTAIGILPREDELSNCALLAKMLDSRSLDAEFYTMLAWYAHIADWCFSEPASLLPLIQSRQIAVPGSLMSLRADSFTNRGTMGSYWVSVINSVHGR